MNTEQARFALEALRKGIPPEGMVRHFTVGETGELLKLVKTKSILEAQQGRSKDEREDGAIFIKPADGAGKTHYLKLIEEEALAQGFAVSFVYLDNKSGIRFDRMDHILGAVLRNLRIPTEPATRGIRPFFRLISDKTKHWEKGEWNSDAKEDPDPFGSALRAWLTGRPGAQALVEDWLYSPWRYANQKRKLYNELILKLQGHFIDKRPKEEFLSGDALAFRAQKYFLSWKAFMWANMYAQLSGLKGLITLFDNFNDIGSLRGSNAVICALDNVRELSLGFLGSAFLSLSPQIRWKPIITTYNDGSRSITYPNYYYVSSETKSTEVEMQPLHSSDLVALFKKIMVAHGIAYGWNPSDTIDESTLGKMAAAACTVKTAGRTRNAVVQCVTYLDSVLQQR